MLRSKEMEILILAAGKGSRFSSTKKKILADFWGISVLELLIYRALEADFSVNIMLNEFLDFSTIQLSKFISPSQQIVSSSSAVSLFISKQDKAKKHNIHQFLQGNQNGTGSAVRSFYSQKKVSSLLVIPGDIPLLDSQTLLKFKAKKADIIVGIMKMPEGFEKYGRIIFHDQKLSAIVEYVEHPQKTEYANSGIIFLNSSALNLLEEIRASSSGEFYLTDIVAIGSRFNLEIDYVELDSSCVLGFNTSGEYQNLLTLAQKKWKDNLTEAGAIFQDKDSVFVSFDTKIASDVIIEPFCNFLPGVEIGPNAHIKSFSYLHECLLDCTVGPFANIRPGTRVENGAVIGSFVELNRSKIKSGAKIKHLAYVGDAEIGENSNIGAGVIFCNYDGEQKHESHVGDDTFIGANSALIAPIKIGDKAFLAAGGVFSEDIPENSFAIARVRQIVKPRRK